MSLHNMKLRWKKERNNHEIFSIDTRQREIEKLQDHTLDLLIIGGGITGAGVAIASCCQWVRNRSNRDAGFC